MKVNIIGGFLGAGKTTFLRRAVGELTAREKVAVLVNEFGKIGIDGDLIRQKHLDVIELPEGCICCTLRTGLVDAIMEIYAKIKPDRLLIEPSGIASAGDLLAVFAEEPLNSVIDFQSLTVIVDLPNFLQSLAGLAGFYRNMLKAGQVLVLNKADLVTKTELKGIQAVLSELNPTAKQLVSVHAAVPLDEIFAPQRPLPEIIEDGHVHFEVYSEVDRENRYEESVLRELFAELSGASFGQVLRAKGVFRISGRSILLEYVFGELQSREQSDSRDSRWAFIGREIDRVHLAEALEACRSSAIGLRR